MLTISKITQQKKNESRYNIFINNEYKFSVNEDVLVRYHLYKGKELTKEDIVKIKASDSWSRAYADALYYLNFRMRSEREMRTFLQKKEIAPAVIDEVIKKLKEEKFLDDLQYAQAFVRDRANRSSKGPNVVRKELQQRGIHEATITKALHEYSNEKAIKNGLRWAKKYLQRKHKDSHKQRMEKLRAQLVQKGYNHDVVSQIVATIDVPFDENEEKDKLRIHGERLYRKYARQYTGYELKQRLQVALYRRGFPQHLIASYIDELEFD